MRRADLHNIRPGISLDYSYDPDRLDDRWLEPNPGLGSQAAVCGLVRG
jgi:hypothetical protein